MTVRHTPSPKAQNTFWVSPHICLTRFDLERRKSGCPGGYDLWGSVTPLHLQKCVARFVSDRRVSCLMSNVECVRAVTV